MTRSLFFVPLALAMTTAASYAQTPAQPAAPRPAAPAVQTPPPAPAPAEPAVPFPAGAKFAYINLQRVASESSEGKTSTSKIQALNDKKVKELGDKNKQLQALQQKLQQSSSVMSDAARGQLEKEIEKQQVEIQRFTQDAQAEAQDLQQELQNEFQRKLVPIIQQVATEKSLQFVFSQIDSGIVWAEPGLDITNDVIKKFDQAGAKPASK